MTNQDFLNKINEIYHMTDLSNLNNILLYGLQNHYTLYKKIDISNSEVNARREKTERIYGRRIHDYAPFYFNWRNAMLYRNKNNLNVVILGFGIKVIKECESVLVANRNASASVVKFSKNLSDLQDPNFIDFNEVFARSWHYNGVRDDNLKQNLPSLTLQTPP